MKKILCMILAIGMLCGAAALVGCKKEKGGNNSSSPRESSQHFNEEGVPTPPEWDIN